MKKSILTTYFLFFLLLLANSQVMDFPFRINRISSINVNQIFGNQLHLQNISFDIGYTDKFGTEFFTEKLFSSDIYDYIIDLNGKFISKSNYSKDNFFRKNEYYFYQDNLLNKISAIYEIGKDNDKSINTTIFQCNYYDNFGKTSFVIQDKLANLRYKVEIIKNNNNINEYTVYNNDGLIKESELYNKFGCLTERTTYNLEGRIDGKLLAEYDQEGHIKHFQEFDKYGTLVLEGKYSYDNNKRLMYYEKCSSLKNYHPDIELYNYINEESINIFTIVKDYSKTVDIYKVISKYDEAGRVIDEMSYMLEGCDYSDYIKNPGIFITNIQDKVETKNWHSSYEYFDNIKIDTCYSFIFNNTSVCKYELLNNNWIIKSIDNEFGISTYENKLIDKCNLLTYEYKEGNKPVYINYEFKGLLLIGF